MKQKSPPRRGAALLKWHVFIFTVFIVALWWSVMSTILANANPDAPFSVYAGFIMSRIGATLFAGIVLLAHFAIYHIRAWILKRQQQMNVVSNIQTTQTKYAARSRLDVDSQNQDGELVDEEMIETAYSQRQRS